MEPHVGRVRQRVMGPTSLPRRRVVLLALVALVALVAACGNGSASAPPAATGRGDVATPEGAAAAVAARSPLFDGIGHRDPDAIGGSAWWTATPLDGATPPAAWTVVYELGWGDCPAGCIDRHTWTYLVEGDGTVTFQEETGSPVADDVLATRLSAAVGPGVGGRVTAGPVCPVETPGDPQCAPRPVPGATLTVRAGDAVVGAFATDMSGLYRLPLAPGDYVLEASPVEGLMGTPAPMPFTVTGSTLTPLDVGYDTGIR